MNPEPSNWPGPDVLRKLCHQMQSASIPGNLSGYQLVCGSSQGLVLSSDVLCKSKSLFPRVWWQRIWLAVPDKGLSSEIEKSLLEVSFPMTKSPGCKV